MKIIALFLFTFIYVRSVYGFTKDRYEQLGVQIFELIQTQFYSSHLNITNQDEDITIHLENIKLITPILSKITYDYDENKPDSFSAKNVIFTLVSSLFINIKHFSTSTPITQNDFLFQLTCESIDFHISNQTSAELDKVNCNDLFFSKINSVSSLNSFKFFTNNADTNKTISEFFSNLISQKLNNILNVEMNLIWIDIATISKEVQKYYTDREILKSIGDIYIYKISVIKYEIVETRSYINQGTFHTGDPRITFQIELENRGSKDTVEFEINTPYFKANANNFDFVQSQADYNICILYLDDGCPELFEKYYIEKYKEIYCEYFKSINDKEECLKRNFISN